ncbi:MAG TPA: TRAP transporter small permease subunit [Burkholderiaceae bacterium]|nr:TRAP transporter small permease subunit [Burkholderiaceae bacterium]
MKALISFTRFLDQINRRLGDWFVSWIMLGIIGVILFEVITRRFIGSPQIWTQEIITYLFCAHFVLALGYTLHYKEHVIADVLTSLMPKKAQIVLETITYLFFIGIFLYVMTPTAIKFSERAWRYGERAATSFNSPIYLVKVLIPVSLILLTIQLVAILLKNGLFIFGGKKIEE